jgi:putative transposase
MSGRRFCRTPGGVCSLGLYLVWCSKCRRRIVGGRVARPCGGLLEQITVEHSWQIVAKDVMPDQVQLFVRVGPIDAPAPACCARSWRTCAGW